MQVRYTFRMATTRDGAASAHILLLAADPRTAEFIEKGLGSDGHEVVVAEDAEVAAFLAATERYDLIVLDVSTHIDGELALLQQNRDSPNAAPVIVVSERDDPDARRTWESAGASAFVPRPLDLPSLRARVNEQLARHTV
jgi:two-component system copper resistance phosphate regulon response regulator CusR